ncbi:hypothetical protein [Arthrobacter sp. AL12]|uniref:hypothetical protein n=1 Tax=Arthrobacter sp. AL12 TaxID=3042241 RepID=UPI00249A8006|nr:hypothetical protein [Arthrobacter sp. AL12]MDI3211791.1 hypothetical protein [Arthrobacter sp. AL12]
MSKRTRLNKTKFYAINRDLKLPGSKVKAVAAVHAVSEESVRTVKRAKTWPRFEAMKKLKNEQRRPAAPSAPLEAVQVHSGLGEPMRQLDKITQAPENQIRPVPSEEVKIVTVGEWEALNRKLGRLYQLLEQKQRKPLLSILGRRK